MHRAVHVTQWFAVDAQWFDNRAGSWRQVFLFLLLVVLWAEMCCKSHHGRLEPLKFRGADKQALQINSASEFVLIAVSSDMDFRETSVFLLTYLLLGIIYFKQHGWFFFQNKLPDIRTKTFLVSPSGESMLFHIKPLMHEKEKMCLLSFQ